jgi:hypothetical protein
MVAVQHAVHRIGPIAVGAFAALGTAAILGVPTDVIPNPWFGRQLPVHAYDVAVLVALSLITGALIASYAVAGGSGVGTKRAGLGSGLLGWFAISCPVCNKLVIALLGTSGATSIVAPVQPALGGAAVVLAAAALAVRLRAISRASCPIPSPRRAPSESRF